MAPRKGLELPKSDRSGGRLIFARDEYRRAVNKAYISRKESNLASDLYVDTDVGRRENAKC